VNHPLVALSRIAKTSFSQRRLLLPEQTKVAANTDAREQKEQVEEVNYLLASSWHHHSHSIRILGKDV
jgi:hypothetical protein